jgi:ZPR1 zinc finger protein
MKVRCYRRSKAQNDELGLHAEAARMGVLAEAEDESQDVDVDEAAEAMARSLRQQHDEDRVAPEEDEILKYDSTLLQGSNAQTLFPTAPRDFSGNEPSRFHKGGALIQNPTERAGLTEQHRRRAGVVRGAGGISEALIFDSSRTDAAKEVMRFPVDCFHCSTRGECRMCVTDVPHFREVILMAFNCEGCGWRNVEVKGGGAVPDKGTITTLRYDPALPEADRDFTRDLIKGDTASVEIPEIDLRVEQGSLGGMYTTVEGLLAAIRGKLLETDAFMSESTDGAKAGVAGMGGASHSTAHGAAGDEFVAKLEQVAAGSVPFTLILQDPMANTWVYSPTAPNPDPRLSHEDYTRSQEEDEELGLLDMQTENYGEDAEETTAAEDAATAAETGTADETKTAQ